MIAWLVDTAILTLHCLDTTLGCRVTTEVCPLLQCICHDGPARHCLHASPASVLSGSEVALIDTAVSASAESEPDSDPLPLSVSADDGFLAFFFVTLATTCSHTVVAAQDHNLVHAVSVYRLPILACVSGLLGVLCRQPQTKAQN